MKILNLTSLEKSEIKYKISKFPDGQQNIVILEDLKDCEDGWCQIGNEPYVKQLNVF